MLASLTSLNLSSCGLTTDGLKAVAGSPFLGRLRRLDSGGNAFGEEGVVALAESPLLGRLTHLNVANTGMKGKRDASPFSSSPFSSQAVLFGPVDGTLVDRLARDLLDVRFYQAVGPIGVLADALAHEFAPVELLGLGWLRRRLAPHVRNGSGLGLGLGVEVAGKWWLVVGEIFGGGLGLGVKRFVVLHGALAMHMMRNT